MVAVQVVDSSHAQLKSRNFEHADVEASSVDFSVTL